MEQQPQNVPTFKIVIGMLLLHFACWIQLIFVMNLIDHASLFANVVLYVPVFSYTSRCRTFDLIWKCLVGDGGTGKTTYVKVRETVLDNSRSRSDLRAIQRYQTGEFEKKYIGMRNVLYHVASNCTVNPWQQPSVLK